MGSIPKSKLISGLPALIIRLRVALRLWQISRKENEGLFRALSALQMLARQRQRLHGHRRDRKVVRCGERYYFSIYTPGFPSKAFDKLITREIRKAVGREDASLQTLILSVSSRCHYGCEHCYEGKNLQSWEAIQLKDLVRVIREAVDLEIPHMQIGGGEPLLRFRDLKKVLEQGRDHMDLWLSTSGYGLTLEKAWDLKVAGLTGAAISLDHYDKEVHNRFRQHPEAFHWAIEAVENCKKSGIVPNLTLTVSRGMASEEQLERYMNLARNLRVPLVRLLEPRKCGNYEGRDIVLSKEQLSEVEEFVIRYNGSRKHSSFPIIQFPGHHQRSIGCFGGGNRYIFIDSLGNFHACPFCRKAAGDIQHLSLAEGIAEVRKQGCLAFKTNLHV